MATKPFYAPSLFTICEVEQTVAAYFDGMENVEDPAAKAEFLEEFKAALLKAEHERDSVVAFLRHCEIQERFADQEILRLKSRKERIARIRSELERYLVELIEQCAPPDRHGVKRLAGNLSSMRIQRNPDSVAVYDADAIPLALKDFVITLPAYVWEGLLECVGLEERSTFEAHVKRIEVKPDKQAIGAELKAGEPIQGAQLQAGAYRLVIS
jgi:Siphovirus Gp157